MPSFPTTIFRLGMSLCFVFMVSLASGAEDNTPTKLPDILEINSPEPIISLPDREGASRGSINFSEKTVVLVFIGLECPVANAYVPEIQTQMAASKDPKVQWFGVHSEPGVTKDEATKHAAEYKLTMPIFLDSEQKLAAAVKAKKLGQVVVVHDQHVVYRGRIDDRFATNGKRRDTPSTHELQDVLAAIAQNKPIAVAETEAYGCPIPFKK